MCMPSPRRLSAYSLSQAPGKMKQISQCALMEHTSVRGLCLKVPHFIILYLPAVKVILYHLLACSL